MFYDTAVALIGLLVVVNILMIRPHWWIALVILATIGTLPTQIPQTIAAGGFSVYISELALAAAAMYVTRTYQPNRLTDLPALVIFSVTTAFCGYGLINGHALNHIAPESRGLFALSLALYITGRIINHPVARTGLKAVAVTLWVSFAFITLSVFGVVRVSGRATDASLSSAGTGPADVTRILSATTHSAAAVLAICIALWVIKPGTFRTTLWFAVPAAGITFFAYSRNAIAIVAITLLLAPLIERRFRKWVRGVVVGGLVVGAFLSAGWTLSQLADLPGIGYLNRMYAAYIDRVLVGLTEEAQQTDTSVLYRQREIVNMWAAVPGNELIGHGLGYEYQPVRDRNTPTSSFYGHQFYLWALVKTGFFGLAAYLAAIGALLVAGLRQAPDPIRSACIAVMIALLYVSTVAPIPLSSNGGPLIGVLLGIAAARITSSGTAKDSRQPLHTTKALTR